MWVICFLVLRFYPKNAEPERSPNFSHHLSLRWAKKRLGWPTNIIKNKMLKYLCSRSLHFLYEGEQRIMISPAIGDAERLSSCSWKLRRKYSQQSQKNPILHSVIANNEFATANFESQIAMTISYITDFFQVLF